MSPVTVETVISIVAGLAAGALVLAVTWSRLKNGVEDDTVQSYRNALDATKAEAEALRHELVNVKAELETSKRSYESQINQLREQVTVLSNMVTARDDIASVRELLESHHREDMTAHDRHEGLLRDVLAMRGGTRSRETFDKKGQKDG